MRVSKRPDVPGGDIFGNCTFERSKLPVLLGISSHVTLLNDFVANLPLSSSHPAHPNFNDKTTTNNAPRSPQKNTHQPHPVQNAMNQIFSSSGRLETRFATQALPVYLVHFEFDPEMPELLNLPLCDSCGLQAALVPWQGRGQGQGHMHSDIYIYIYVFKRNIPKKKYIYTFITIS